MGKDRWSWTEKESHHVQQSAALGSNSVKRELDDYNIPISWGRGRDQEEIGIMSLCSTGGMKCKNLKRRKYPYDRPFLDEVNTAYGELRRYSQET